MESLLSRFYLTWRLPTSCVQASARHESCAQKNDNRRTKPSLRVQTPGTMRIWKYILQTSNYIIYKLIPPSLDLHIQGIVCSISKLAPSKHEKQKRLLRDIIPRHGLPFSITTENGPTFLSSHHRQGPIQVELAVPGRGRNR